MKKNIDPVCGMVGKDDIKAEYNGKNYYFCAEGCREQFLKNPLKYTR